MYVDIHTHQLPKVGSIGIQNLTVSEAKSTLSSNTNGCFSVGIHPWFANSFTSRSFQELEFLAMDKRVVAIGECGLDKNSAVSLELQKSVFEKQIELSEKIKKPLIIHCVGCFNELFEIKRRIKPAQLWIIHGFRGKPELAKQALKFDFGLSFGEHYNPESVRITTLEKLYLETDESPLAISELYEQIAKIKACKMTDLSAGRLFMKEFL
jgi:TatD DNase family protein